MTIQILLSAAFLAAVLWLGFRVPAAEGGAPQRRPLFGLPAAPVFCTVLAAALVLRLILGYSINGFDADIACFKAWGYYTHEVGFSGMYYSDFFLDYPPGYLYLLYLTEFFRRLFFIPDYAQGATLLVKIVPILSDIGTAAIVWAFARKKLGENGALFVSAQPSSSTRPCGGRPTASARSCCSGRRCCSGGTTRPPRRSFTASACSRSRRC